MPAPRKLTVNELFNSFYDLMRAGLGDAEVYAFTDEEGNFIRPLYTGMEPGVPDKDDADYYDIPRRSIVIG